MPRCIGTLSPQLEIEPMAPLWKLGVLTTGLPGNSPVDFNLVTWQWLEIEPMAPVWKRGVLTTGLPGNSPVDFNLATWQRHSTPVFLPGESHGRRSLVGCSPWGRWESDTTGWLHFHFSLPCVGLEKEMATHSCILAWRIPGTGKPGGLPSVGVTQSRTRLKRLSSSGGKVYR